MGFIACLALCGLTYAALQDGTAAAGLFGAALMTGIMIGLLIGWGGRRP